MEGSMKFIGLICLFSLIGCSNYRHPSSLGSAKYAEDSLASGSVKADAVRSAENQDVCFDINIAMKNVEQNLASPSNWTIAWVDRQNQYHLLNLNQRDPASVPKGGRVAAQYGEYQEWTNHFRTCAKASMHEVKGLVLTPKNLPYQYGDGLHLNWQ
jgi:hypothetical protein